MPFAQTPPAPAGAGVRLHYRCVGQGPQDLLFVHGSYASGRWWLPVTELMAADRYTAYLPDLRGCGQSQRSTDIASYAVEQQAADLAGLVATLGLRGFHLIGHSLGAAIALTYCVAYPASVRSLVLVSTPSPQGTVTPEEGLRLLEEMRRDRSLLLRGLASTMPARAPDRFFQQLVDDAQGQAPAAFTAHALALASWHLPKEALSQLRLPVLLVCGDQDQIVEHDVQRELLVSIPGASNLEVFRGTGHTPHLERTEGFVQALQEFIEEDFEAYAAMRSEAGE